MARRTRRLPGLRRALLIAVSGRADAGRRRLAAVAGFDFYVPKPADLGTLEALLMSHQGEPSADPAPATRTAGEHRPRRKGRVMTPSDRPPRAAVPAPPADILGVDDDDGARRSLAAGLPPDGAPAGPAAADTGAPAAGDLRTFGTPDVLRKPFSAAETGRKRRKEARQREEEEVARDDQWRDDGGQGHRPVP